MTGETLAQRIIALASDAAAARRDGGSCAGAGEARRGKSDRGSRVPAAGAILMLGRTRRIHFVGIGGIGMSGIAELLANLGYEVSGSDAKRSEGHGSAGDSSAFDSSSDTMRPMSAIADVVVVSSAIAPATRKRRRQCAGKFRSSRAQRCSPSSCGCATASRLPARTARRRRHRWWRWCSSARGSIRRQSSAAS